MTEKQGGSQVCGAACRKRSPAAAGDASALQAELILALVNAQLSTFSKTISFVLFSLVQSFEGEGRGETGQLWALGLVTKPC